MSTRHLLISNPPHGDVDAAEAAPHFGLAAAEVRMKANYGLPEIWFAGEDEAELGDTAAGLIHFGPLCATCDNPARTAPGRVYKYCAECAETMFPLSYKRRDDEL